MGLVASTPRITVKVTWDHTNMRIPAKGCIRTWCQLCACPFGRESIPKLPHVFCGESSKRYWENYDDLNPFSQPLFQILDSSWTSYVCRILGGCKVHPGLCVVVLLVGITVCEAVGRRECVEGWPLCPFPACWALRSICCPYSWICPLEPMLHFPLREHPQGSRYCLDWCWLPSPCEDWLYHGLWCVCVYVCVCVDQP